MINLNKNISIIYYITLLVNDRSLICQYSLVAKELIISV